MRPAGWPCRVLLDAGFAPGCWVPLLDAGFRLCLPGSAFACRVPPPPDAGHAYEMHRIILLKRLFRCFSLKWTFTSNFFQRFLDVASWIWVRILILCVPFYPIKCIFFLLASFLSFWLQQLIFSVIFWNWNVLGLWIFMRLSVFLCVPFKKLEHKLDFSECVLKIGLLI